MKTWQWISNLSEEYELTGLMKSRLFLFGLLIRLLLLPFFGSHYVKDLFIPFLDGSITNLGSNPWSLLPAAYFPYGSVIFALLFIPRYVAYLVCGNLALGSSFLGLSLIKLPLLFLDLGLFIILIQFHKLRTSQLLKFYWLNPIAIYISYIHVQLDIAAMTFCLLSLLLLIKNRMALSAIAMAAATLCKFHVVAIIPVILAFVWNRRFAKQAVRDITFWSGLWGGLTLLGFLPLIASHKFFYASISSPEAFRIFGAQLNFGDNQILYIGVLSTLIVLGRLCISTRLTDRGLVFGAGAVFGVILLTTSTAPGWYFWILPFIALLFSHYLNIHRIIFWSFNTFFLIYFVLIQPNSDSIGTLGTGIGYTFLQTSLGGILIAMWTVAIRSEAILQGRARPALIGMAGDSGSGKNHLSAVLKDLFNSRNTSVVEGDNYHKWERKDDRWKGLTHLNPKANYLSALANHTSLLSRGQPVFQSEYDHNSGIFTEPKEFRPSKTIILQGLHTFYLRGMRNSLDLKIFLAPHELVRLSWKLGRDVKERGHSPEKVIASIFERQTDSEYYIVPQRKYADWIIEYLPNEPVTMEEVLSGKTIHTILKYTVWTDASIDCFLNELAEYEHSRVKIEIEPNVIDRTTIEIQGHFSSQFVGEVANKIFPNLRNITRGWSSPIWHEGYDGINQLMTIALLNGKT